MAWFSSQISNQSAPDDLRQVVDALAAFLLPVALQSMMPNGLTPWMPGPLILPERLIREAIDFHIE